MTKFRLLLLVSYISALVGCGFKQSATYDISAKEELNRVEIIDNRINAKPTPEVSDGRYQRIYIGQQALGPDMLDIVKARLALHEQDIETNTSVSINKIEISLIKVDNDMGGNSNDPTHGLPVVITTDIGTLELNLDWLRAKSLVSVRSKLHYSIDNQDYEETEYGMSTYSKMEPEIQHTLYRSIDLLAEKLKIN